MTPPKDETVELVRHEVAFQGYFKVGRYVFRHSLFQGGTSDMITREVFERGQSAAILPYDPRRDEVVLIRQFRAGSYVSGRHAFGWEIPAGMIEAGETPEKLVVREAEEEANIVVKRVERLYTLMLSPGAVSQSCTFFVGEADASTAGGIFGLVSEGENILVKRFALAEALAMTARNEIANTVGVCAIQWLALNRNELRKRWA
jgi:ADP-ribose pyrophosphatase